jgi:hypothetical protein
VLDLRQASQTVTEAFNCCAIFLSGTQAEKMLNNKIEDEDESNTKELSAYEKQRLVNMERNAEGLASLHAVVNSPQQNFSSLKVVNDFLGETWPATTRAEHSRRYC